MCARSSVGNERSLRVFYFFFIHVLTIKDGLRFFYVCLRSITLLISHFFPSASPATHVRALASDADQRRESTQIVIRYSIDGSAAAVETLWIGNEVNLGRLRKGIEKIIIRFISAMVLRLRRGEPSERSCTKKTFNFVAFFSRSLVFARGVRRAANRIECCPNL